MENLRDLVHVPSVQMHMAPDKSIGEALGMRPALRMGMGGVDEGDDDDEVDGRIRELIKRRNDATYTNNNASDSESSDDTSGRNPRYVNRGAGRKTRPVGKNGGRDISGEDPCGGGESRKKRSFFKSSGFGMDMGKKKIGIMGDIAKSGGGEGYNGSIGGGGGEGWAFSRAVSPAASIV